MQYPSPRKGANWGRLSLIGAGLLFGGTFAHAQLANQELPGAVGNVAGHVASQREQAQEAPRNPWLEPGRSEVIPSLALYDNPHGQIGILNEDGAVQTKGHPFFTPLGTNGRACVTCHQPNDAMSISVETVQRRWKETGGKDPLFAPIDGSNCPSLPQGDPKSHSLLLEKGLFRIFLPWPPKTATGAPLKPEFTLEVVSDPTGCNFDPVYGLKGKNPMISVFRRPRVVGNLKYVMQPYAQFFNIKLGTPLEKDPETGVRVGMNLLADSRQPTLKAQAVEAGITHLQMTGMMTPEQLAVLEKFERQIFVAQIRSKRGGDLTDTPAVDGLGPAALRDGKPGLGNIESNPVFRFYDAWRADKGAKLDDQAAFRASVARGSDVFFKRPFFIRNVTYINSIGLGNPVKRQCATCHNASHTGMDVAPGWIDLGTANLPTANVSPDLPVFKLTCRPDVRPHPYLGRVIYTHDPGRAIISGKCTDIGAITMQQMRGLSARAPYFANGSAASLDDLVSYYDRRFNMGLTSTERQDLINFLSVL
ncbi:hypothetical protein [Sphingomonas soli]|uniref:hypothetical protein n=1 Tax=Sphingomonas soli TaxID=266127 RepID=UPI000B0DD6DF|nr:hypothetical protein [Sphingomonas soli]